MKNRYHFIAIGGSAMHSLALALHHNNYNISGSDDEIFDPAKTRLQNAGLLPAQMGWFPEKITPELHGVILGMHAKADNPELLKAKEIGVPIFSYPEFLHKAFVDKKRIVIGGSHGKTTITSMILHIFNTYNLDMDYMVGAQLKGLDNPVKISQAALAIIEGDEYLTSPIDLRPKFHLYKPHLAIISGIAWDHINVFPTFEKYLEQFSIFIDTIEPNGVLLYNNEDEMVRKVVSENTRTDITKIPYQTPDYKQFESHADIHFDSQTFRMQVFGRHNFLNAAAAIGIAKECGLTEEQAWKALESFTGAEKRLEKLEENEKGSVYKDFAHAPSKVTSTLSAFLEKTQKALPCFELHTYSSLNKEFLPQYAGSLNSAEEAVVYFSPHALEIKRLPMLSEEDIRTAFNHPNLKIFTAPKDLKDFILSKKGEYKHLLMMSSGNWDGLDLKELAKEFLG